MASQCIIVRGRDILHPGNVRGEGGKGGGGGHSRGSASQVILRQVLRRERGRERKGERGERGEERERGPGREGKKEKRWRCKPVNNDCSLESTKCIH